MIEYPNSTLVVIKPDAVRAGLVGGIIKELEEQGCGIVRCRGVKLTPEFCKVFYREHVQKDFYPRLVEFMCSGLSIALEIVPVTYPKMSKSHFIDYVRDLIGNYDPKQAEKDTIRSLYGAGMPNNAIHASDSEDAFYNEHFLLFSMKSGITI